MWIKGTQLCLLPFNPMWVLYRLSTRTVTIDKIPEIKEKYKYLSQPEKREGWNTHQFSVLNVHIESKLMIIKEKILIHWAESPRLSFVV